MTTDLASMGITSIPEDTFEYKAGLGGDTGRGELPNLPAPVQVDTDYNQLMQPKPLTNLAGPDELAHYSSKQLGLPTGAPPVHQLSLLAGRYSPDDEQLNSDKARQVGAGLIGQQLRQSKDTGWQREPIFKDYITSLGLDFGRPDSWGETLKKNYGI